MRGAPRLGRQSVRIGSGCATGVEATARNWQEPTRMRRRTGHLDAHLRASGGPHARGVRGVQGLRARPAMMPLLSYKAHDLGSGYVWVFGNGAEGFHLEDMPKVQPRGLLFRFLGCSLGFSHIRPSTLRWIWSGRLGADNTRVADFPQSTRRHFPRQEESYLLRYCL
jgi:hypothetical protein